MRKFPTLIANHIETAGLEVKKEITYWTKTEYSDDNETYADALFDAIDTDPDGITLPLVQAKEQGLILADPPFPWEESRGIYYIRGFHDLHCLVCLSQPFQWAAMKFRLTNSLETDQEKSKWI